MKKEEFLSISAASYRNIDIRGNLNQADTNITDTPITATNESNKHTSIIEVHIINISLLGQNENISPNFTFSDLILIFFFSLQKKIPKAMDEYMRKVLEKIERMNAYDERVRIANQHNQNRIDELVLLVNDIFSKHGVNGIINKNHIRFNADFIGNIMWIEDKKLSRLILDHIYPKPRRRTFSHYTRFGKGTSIIRNKEFWMFNLLQNFDFEEFRLFYREHGMDGYEQDDEVLGVKTGYRQLMSEIFALCLTTEENTSPTLWNYFADRGTGLKLTFEIESHIPDFREVYYSNIVDPGPIPLLRDLFAEIRNRFNYVFNFTYMSKIGAFYLKGTFENEQEYRFLIKRTSDDYSAYRLQPMPFYNDISYIILPFESEFASFKLLKVEKGPHCLDADFDQLIPDITLNHANVEIIR